MSALPRLAARVAAAMALVGLVATERAQAQVPGAAATAVIAAAGVCPDQAAVWAELGTLVPRDRFAAHLAQVAGAGPAIEIADLGGTYRVAAAGRMRVYRDDARVCGERARVAALFIALAIDPADTAPTSPPVAAASPRENPPPAPPVAAPRRPPLINLEVGPGLDVGLGSAGTTAAPAAVVALAVGRGHLAALFQVAADLPADAVAGRAALRQWRAPFSLGVRASLARQRAAPYAELGLAAGPIVARGRDIVAPATAVSLEVGLLAAVGIRLGDRTGAFLVARGEIVPDPPDVFASPVGAAGHTPRLWLGAAAGLSLGVH